MQPDNIEGLKPVKINEVLYQSILFSAKINDQHFRGINTFFTHAVGLLVHVLDKLISLEASTQKDGSCVKTEQGKIQIRDCLFDVHDMRTKVNDVCRLLCAGNSTVLQKHKGLLKSWVLPKYQYLTKPNNPVSDDLLGPNIEQRICDSAKLSEAARKIGHGFRGRYHGAQSRFSKGFQSRAALNNAGDRFEQQRFRENEYKNEVDRFPKHSRSFKPRGGSNRHFFNKGK